MILAEGDQVIETFPAEGAEESLAKAIRQGRANWRPKDADAHRGDGRIQAGGKDAVPIVEEPCGSARISRNCCRVQAAVGWAVTLTCSRRRLPISRATKT